MKLKKLLGKAKKELKTTKELKAVELIKQSIKNISDCKKTLRKLEQKHKELLSSEIDDLELDDFEY